MIVKTTVALKKKEEKKEKTNQTSRGTIHKPFSIDIHISERHSTSQLKINVTMTLSIRFPTHFGFFFLNIISHIHTEYCDIIKLEVVITRIHK